MFAILAVVFTASPALAYDGEELHRTMTLSGPRAPDSFTAPADPLPIALYDGAGAWGVGVEHLKLHLRDRGRSYRTLDAGDLLGGALEREDFSALVMPGGESWTYLDHLGDEGANAILSFVEGGGGYVGICAGAFYATSRRQGGVRTGPYGIGLLQGTAYDGTALKREPFIEGMMDFRILLQGLSSTHRIVLLGGPSFRYTAEESRASSIEVWAEFQRIDEPAMIALRYGAGRVFLSGPHLEVEEPLLDWGPRYQDPESDWPILDRAMDRVTAPSPGR